jgi:hypothetical protein
MRSLSNQDYQTLIRMYRESKDPSEKAHIVVALKNLINIFSKFRDARASVIQAWLANEGRYAGGSPTAAYSGTNQIRRRKGG